MRNRDRISREKVMVEAYGIPSYVYQAYRSHLNNALRRDIPFEFDIVTWHSWWITELAKYPAHTRRGRLKGNLMMCRYGDSGAYAPGNVYAGTHAQNTADTLSHLAETPSERMLKWHASNDSHLKGKRGFAHPKSRAVIDHEGVLFGSIALASEKHGITRQAGFYKIKSGTWKYTSEQN